MTKTTINLPSNLMQDAKIYAVQNQTSVTQLLIRGLEYTLNEKKRKQKTLSAFLETFPHFSPMSDDEREKNYRNYLEKRHA